MTGPRRGMGTNPLAALLEVPEARAATAALAADESGAAPDRGGGREDEARLSGRGGEIQVGLQRAEAPASAAGGSLAGSAVARRPRKRKLRADIDAGLHARARAAAYWEPGTTVTGLVELGLALILERLESERGEPYPPPRGPLRLGRPPVGD